MLIEGKSVSEAARMFGLNESVVRNYVSGRSLPGLPHALKIAEATGVSVDWLGGRAGASRDYDGKTPMLAVHASFEEADGLVKVPHYGIEAGAGLRVVETEDKKSWLWISREWTTRFGKSSLSVINIAGDSMVPLMDSSDHVLLNMADKTRGPGVRLVRLGDSLTVKRCEPLPRDGLLLKPENPAYEPFKAAKGEYEIIGAIVAVIKVLE